MLLDQLASELPDVRPAVLSESLKYGLDEFRRFRHFVRNVYTHGFDPLKLKVLIDLLSPTLESTGNELAAFANFLDTVAKD